jgi:hypothetical protein
MVTEGESLDTTQELRSAAILHLFPRLPVLDQNVILHYCKLALRPEVGRDPEPKRPGGRLNEPQT